jgi:ferredoxin
MEEKDEVKSTKKIVVDHNVCIGCGTCEGVAPDYFQLEDGLANAIVPYKEDDADIIDEAIASCPVAAISISDSNKANKEE